MLSSFSALRNRTTKSIKKMGFEVGGCRKSCLVAFCEDSNQKQDVMSIADDLSQTKLSKVNVFDKKGQDQREKGSEFDL